MYAEKVVRPKRAVSMPPSEVQREEAIKGVLREHRAFHLGRSEGVLAISRPPHVAAHATGNATTPQALELRQRQCRFPADAWPTSEWVNKRPVEDASARHVRCAGVCELHPYFGEDDDAASSAAKRSLRHGPRGSRAETSHDPSWRQVRSAGVARRTLREWEYCRDEGGRIHRAEPWPGQPEQR